MHFSLGSGVFPATAAKNSPQMTLLFSHLANLGYAVVARDDNPHANLGCCSEFTFLRVENRLHGAESQLGAIIKGTVKKLMRRLKWTQ